ncbi:MAG: NADH:flavin oxidoreductase [Ruminococcaceae bacterium]|nr:NADH:flavin oxidoreductase [Oscillospiraceae bacterium]
MANLSTPLTIKNTPLKNRVVFPAMLVCDFHIDDAKVNQEYIDHYNWLADSGVGMIIAGAVTVRPDGMMAPMQLGIWSDDFIEGLAKIPEITHKRDVPVLMLINHAGLNSVSTDDPVASSDIELNGKKARALTKAELKDIQQCYIDAAVRAEKAGFDGIQLQCSHIYLVDTFLSSLLNTRTDEYGGSVENRVRFATEIIAGIKEKVSPNFILSCRLPYNATSIEDAVEMAKLLEKAGCDFFDISWGSIGMVNITEDKGPQPPEGFGHGALTYGASRVKEAVSVPVSAVYRVTSTEANSIIEDGLADLVASLRGLLVDPDWVEKAKKGKASNKCYDCRPICHWYRDRNKCPAWNKLDASKRLNV